ncbi:hypothetical protein PC129_g22637 [Phytophthora cactorum]|uniref:Uncharacterized protein n=1 Tax=Phytophthora cactorum TaxID=29920 RepID=A0A8T0Z4R7_9STRA|nr:hypothetical protein PC112_g20311 [Phytophthora cactorum]KAG2818541.1 hypothetical protein PC111_g12257 [Phytophthora cactorum]KAG2857324.1 hypothetical protein PC113_g10782 [Phytophthora cactorum]KAG2899565.1 hypothetical protein PC114_g13876 [Phytophthora cactorum]KAG2978534.1 hypothetical protein PC118_g12207 [Phytophthora cactorum]
MKAGEMMLIFGVGIFATRLAMGQTVANVDDLTSTLEPTETATDESSSGTAELREGYDHKDHYGKMGENCDDHDRKHDHVFTTASPIAAATVPTTASPIGYSDYYGKRYGDSYNYGSNAYGHGGCKNDHGKKHHHSHRKHDKGYGHDDDNYNNYNNNYYY